MTEACPEPAEAAAATLAEQPATATAAASDSPPLTGDRLADALAVFAHVIDRRATVPVLECVRLTAGGGKLEIKGTNLDHQLTCALPYAGPAFIACVPHHSLLTAAETFGEEEPGFIAAPGSLRLHGSAGEFALTAHPAEDYHELLRADPMATVSFERKELIRAIADCRRAISKEETRYYLLGLCLTQKERRVEFVATDGHRLHARLTTPAFLDGEIPQIIVHKRGARCLLSVLERASEEEIVMEVGGDARSRRAAVAVGAWTVETKCIDGTYPDYSRVIPTEFSGSATLDGAALANSFRAIDKLGSRDIKAAALDIVDRTVRYREPDGLTFSRKVDVSVMGDVPPSVGFNVRYFSDILATHCESALTLHFPDASGGSPMLITFAGDEDFRAVLMPLRV